MFFTALTAHTTHPTPTHTHPPSSQTWLMVNISILNFTCASTSPKYDFPIGVKKHEGLVRTHTSTNLRPFMANIAGSFCNTDCHTSTLWFTLSVCLSTNVSLWSRNNTNHLYDPFKIIPFGRTWTKYYGVFCHHDQSNLPLTDLAHVFVSQDFVG